MPRIIANAVINTGRKRVAPASSAADKGGRPASSLCLAKAMTRILLAVATPIVFVGEAVAGASTITRTVAYAYNGLYTSAFATVPSGTGTVFSSNSNIGDTNVRATLRLRCTSSENGYTTGDIVSPMIIGGGGYWQTAPVTVQRNSVQSVTGATTAIGGNNKTSGAVASFTPSNWSYSFVVNRSY